MRQAQPLFGEMLNPAAAAEVLNIDPAEIDSRYPIQEVSTGLPFIIIPLKRLQVQSEIKVNIERFISLVETVEAKSIYVFCPETYNSGNNLNARMFDYYNGIPEDPATGSAAGCLAAYLVKYRYCGEAEIDLRIEQGMEIKRPSLLRIRASDRGGQVEISVGGRVIPVAEGRLL
jgi:trans-2,3-dihydro-3-hydroxyanthranilate isomerase